MDPNHNRSVKLAEQSNYYPIMTQPELGKKLQELRQSKGTTQQEISEACNISMRTIQRIELGKVDPRPVTIKLILDHLGENYENFMANEKTTQGAPSPSRGFYMITVGAGLIYFVLGFPETYFDYRFLEEGLTQVGMYTTIKLLVVGSYVGFMAGFVRLSRSVNSKLLEFSALALIVVTAGFYLTHIAFAWLDMDDSIFYVAEAISGGTLLLVFGVSLYQLRSRLGSAAQIAGVLEVLTGLSFFFVVTFFIGLILAIPAILAEIYLLYQASCQTEVKPTFS